MNAFEELKWRGFIYDHTEEIPTLLANKKITLYNGFDPTGDTLHIGHLVPMMALARLQRYGHTPIALAGGGTGMIGDPSGRSTERNLLTAEEIEANLGRIQEQLSGILDFEVKSNPARVMNNADWLNEVKLIPFLRDIGKHFTVNYMMAKDSVKSRLAREDGISYTEFSYMLLQSYDFMHLLEHHNCTVQMGGSDQWGNITAGVELIRRATGQKTHALVFPLITQADGTKFGKTAAGTNAWLAADRTSPYRFYQFWFNTNDADVINYLRLFTWLDQHTIAGLEDALFERPHERAAQQTLAREITRMIHGETAVSRAEKASAVLFGGEMDELNSDEIAEIFADVPTAEIANEQLDGEGLPLVDLLVMSELETSKGAARRAIDGGGIYLNNRRVNEQDKMVAIGDCLDGRYLVLRKGRKRYRLVRVLG
ncbi:MAG: tyrosine--tRNA ligase [Candidatus Promineifilaceae bacterium]